VKTTLLAAGSSTLDVQPAGLVPSVQVQSTVEPVSLEVTLTVPLGTVSGTGGVTLNAKNGYCP